MLRFFIAITVLLFPAKAIATDTIEDLAFLEGHWRGGSDGFVFEEIWSSPEGGVMTAMARGISGETVRVLEYVVISEENGQLVMRFKHFNTDYSVWTGEENAPLELTLKTLDGTDAVFTADPPTHSVASIRYWKPSDKTLQVDVKQIENGEPGGFSLLFKRID